MIGFPSADSTTHPSSRRLGPAFGRRGMVAAAHPLVVSTGLDVLRRGGNAVDAAVAAALTAAVVMPEMCGLGGDLFAIVHSPGLRGGPVAFLGSGIAPRSATIERMREDGRAFGESKMPLRGPLSVGVPGMVAGYGGLLEKFGSRALAELAAPAIGHAEDGYPMTRLGADHLAANAGPLLAQFPTSAAVFMPGGRPPAVGEVFRQPDLARTLRQIATDGPDAFYRGDIARRIGAFMAESGGALSASDLAGHETVVEPTIQTTYRGLTVHQTGLPSQGMILLEALNIAENADPRLLARGDAAAVHILAEALKLAYADRLGFARDPTFGETPLPALLSKAWAARRFAKIDSERAAEDVPAGAMQDGDTTYLCVADGDGMMISLIQSVSSLFGSGVVAGDTGVLLNNRVGRGFSLEPGHPNLYAPGKKTMSTLNCWMVSDTASEPVLVGGTPGGDGQPQWNLQALVGLIDCGMDVQAAVEVPRWSVWPGTDPHDRPNPYELRVETRLGEEAMAGLEARGHRLRRMGEWGGGGGAQIIARDPETGVLAGGSDARVEGMALGF